MHRRSFFAAGLVFSLAVALTSTAAAATPMWATTCLTAASGGGSAPVIADGRVVWAGPSAPFSPSRVYLWSAGEVAPTPVPDAYGTYPKVSGDRVVWEGWDSTGVHTWALGDTAPTALGTSAGFNASVSGDRVAWMDQGDIYTWIPGGEPQDISNLPGIDDNPQVSGDHIVWTNRADQQVYLWTVGDSAPTNISESTLGCSGACISGDRAAWTQVVRIEEFGGSDIRVYTDVFTRAVGDNASSNVSNTDSDTEEGVAVDGDRIVWSGDGSGDSEIYTWAAGDAAPTNVSNHPGLYDVTPQVSGDRVVWRGWDGNDDEVYTWVPSAGQATNVSQHDGLGDDSPSVSGGRIVWQGFDGTAWQVYAAATPVQMADDVLAFIDTSADNGALTGTGSRPEDRLATFRETIESARAKIEGKSSRDAVRVLLDAYARCDGRPNPPDYVMGPARGRVATLVSSLIEAVGGRAQVRLTSCRTRR